MEIPAAGRDQILAQSVNAFDGAGGVTGAALTGRSFDDSAWSAARWAVSCGSGAARVCRAVCFCADAMSASCQLALTGCPNNLPLSDAFLTKAEITLGQQQGVGLAGMWQKKGIVVEIGVGNEKGPSDCALSPWNFWLRR